MSSVISALSTLDSMGYSLDVYNALTVIAKKAGKSFEDYCQLVFVSGLSKSLRRFCK